MERCQKLSQVPSVPTWWLLLLTSHLLYLLLFCTSTKEGKKEDDPPSDLEKMTKEKDREKSSCHLLSDLLAGHEGPLSSFSLIPKE